MSLGKNVVEITLVGEYDDKISAQIGQTSRTVQKALKDIEGVASGLKTAFKDIALGGGIVGGGLALIAREAGESEAAISKLNAGLRASDQYTDAMSKSLQDDAKALQAHTIHSDEAIMSAQALFARFGMGESDIKRATKATIGLSSAIGIDLDSAAMLMTKAFQGNTDTLGRYGIKIAEGTADTEKFAALLNLIEGRKWFSISESEAQTFTGSIKILGNSFQELVETVGGEFTPIIKQAALDLTKFAQSDEAVRMAKEFGQDLRVVAEGLAKIVPPLVEGGMAVAKFALEHKELTTILAGGLVFRQTLGPLISLGKAVYDIGGTGIPILAKSINSLTATQNGVGLLAKQFNVLGLAVSGVTAAWAANEVRMAVQEFIALKNAIDVDVKSYESMVATTKKFEQNTRVVLDLYQQAVPVLEKVRAGIENAKRMDDARAIAGDAYLKFLTDATDKQYTTAEAATAWNAALKRVGIDQENIAALIGNKILPYTIRTREETDQFGNAVRVAYAEWNKAATQGTINQKEYNALLAASRGEIDGTSSSLQKCYEITKMADQATGQIFYTATVNSGLLKQNMVQISADAIKFATEFQTSMATVLSSIDFSKLTTSESFKQVGLSLRHSVQSAFEPGAYEDVLKAFGEKISTVVKTSLMTALSQLVFSAEMMKPVFEQIKLVADQIKLGLTPDFTALNAATLDVAGKFKEYAPLIQNVMGNQRILDEALQKLLGTTLNLDPAKKAEAEAAIRAAEELANDAAALRGHSSALGADVAAIDNTIRAFTTHDGVLYELNGRTQEMSYVMGQATDGVRGSLGGMDDSVIRAGNNIAQFAEAARAGSEAVAASWGGQYRSSKTKEDIFAELSKEIPGMGSTWGWQVLQGRMKHEDMDAQIKDYYDGLIASAGTDYTRQFQLQQEYLGILQLIDQLYKAMGGANGLDFIVGGRSGTDANLVPLKLTRGERVTVTPPGKAAGTVINCPITIYASGNAKIDRDMVRNELLPEVLKALKRQYATNLVRA
jgi:hypothetical protein